MVQHLTAEPPDRALLYRDNDLVLARQSVNQVGVERFGESRVRNRRRKTVSAELLRSLQGFGQAATEAEQRDLGPFPHNTPSADLERDSPFGERHADPVATRITHRRRRIV